eukprot:m.6649 g.6649  ORF g.6649 m.6649 type:complete len:545 (+) comp3562_c0_seq1:321-1955(+)
MSVGRTSLFVVFLCAIISITHVADVLMVHASPRAEEFTANYAMDTTTASQVEQDTKTNREKSSEWNATRLQGCEGRCWRYSKKAPCQCNEECLFRGDCCSDYKDHCTGTPLIHLLPLEDPDEPDGVFLPSSGLGQYHLSLTHDPSVMSLTFVTPKGFQCVLPGCQCKFAVSQQYSKMAPPSWIETKHAMTYTYENGSWVGDIHRVLFEGLQPSQKYVYTCDNAETIYSFRGPKLPGSYPVVIGAIADLGLECADEMCGNYTIEAMANATRDGLLDFVLHAGDIAYTSGNQSIWDMFFNEIQPIASSIPYQVCVGNHESHYNFTAYRYRFAMPGESDSQDGPQGPGPLNVNNLWNEYTYGAVHVISFSTEHYLGNNSEQLAWLEAKLKAAADPARRATVPWIIVMAHRPMYCSSSDYYDCGFHGPKYIRAPVEPLLNQYGVDLFLAGHLHNYERSWPIYNGSVVSHSYAYNGTGHYGTTHFVIGMAGDDEGLSDKFVSPSPQWSATHAGSLGWQRITAYNSTTLDVEYVASESGAILDSIRITKP